ncbi:MAG: four helix bundle protein, partial [Bdellovibrionales bacterium]|nr:four helix bundle protein [Bdellovibrionales bacterium]
ELNQNCSQLGLTGELRQQLERAVLSIALNLAEGTGRGGKDRLGGMIYQLLQRPGRGP